MLAPLVAFLALIHVASASPSSAGDRDFRRPLEEPTFEEFAKVSSQTQAPLPVPRYRDLNSSLLQALVQRGLPFVVEDAGKGNPFLGKECSWFHETFPKAKMRAEYTGGRSEKWVSLGKENWLTEGRKTQPHAEQSGANDAKEFNAPYVWHVKDGGHEAPPAVKAALQGMWRPAYFLEDSLVNVREANESQEFWFSLRNGSVMAHADTYCIPAASMQLRGRKKWKLMASPPPVPSISERYDSHDGGIYGTGLWRPQYETTVEEGEAIIFFPNQFHETFVPEDNPPCTVATTFQFQQPLPVRYFRSYLPALSMSHLYFEGHCKDLWHHFSTFEPPGKNADSEELGRSLNKWQTTLQEEKIQRTAGNLFRVFDTDGDAAVTAEELKAFYEGSSNQWARWFLTEDYFYEWRPQSSEEREVMGDEVLASRVADTLAYHDLDEDGSISPRELYESMLQWNVVHHRLKDSYKARKSPARVKEVELRLKKYRSRAPSAEDGEGEEAKKSKKKAKKKDTKAKKEGDRSEMQANRQDEL